MAGQRLVTTRPVSTTLDRSDRRRGTESGTKHALLEADVVDPGSPLLQDRDLATLFRGRVTRARRARLRESYVVIVRSGGTVAAAVACKPVNRHVWAVHEFALRSTLACERDRAVDIAMDALEAACLAQGSCAIVVLRTDIAPRVLKRRSYILIIERCGGAWFQKHLSPDPARQFGRGILP